jgi:hypothetical protein
MKQENERFLLVEFRFKIRLVVYVATLNEMLLVYVMTYSQNKTHPFQEDSRSQIKFGHHKFSSVTSSIISSDK